MTGSDPIETYLDQLARGLTVAGRDRDAIIDEIHDGLLEATAASVARGVAPRAAAAHAAQEFGDPATLALDFQQDLAARRSRQNAIWLLATGPIIGALWAATAHFSHLIPRLADGHGPLLAVRLALGLAIVTTITTATLAIAATGPLNRWFTIPTRLPLTAAATGLTITATIDAAVLTAVAIAAITTPSSIAWTVALVATTASTLRLTLTARATRTIVGIRHSISA